VLAAVDLDVNGELLEVRIAISASPGGVRGYDLPCGFG
jgi:hypothetical protein